MVKTGDELDFFKKKNKEVSVSERKKIGTDNKIGLWFRPYTTYPNDLAVGAKSPKNK